MGLLRGILGYEENVSNSSDPLTTDVMRRMMLLPASLSGGQGFEHR